MVDDLLGFRNTPKVQPDLAKKETPDEWGVFSDPAFGTTGTFTDAVDNTLASLAKRAPQPAPPKKQDILDFDPMNFTSEPNQQAESMSSKVDDLLSFNTQQPKKVDIFSSFA